ncbi:MAG: magnesium/cobalt transporter CorA [Candidatus Sulfobium sp.]
MLRFIKKRSGKSGLPPGSLIHIGEKKTDRTKIAVMDYDDREVREKETGDVEECLLFRDSPAVTWIDVEGIHDTRVLQRLGDCYGFHPLVLEDILNTDQRPKMEDYTGYLFIVLKRLSANGSANGIASEQISFILGPSYVLSFQEGMAGDIFGPTRERIRKNGAKLRKMGADYLVYTLMDAIVDNYFTVLEAMGEKVEVLEEKLVSAPTDETLRDIQYMKRELIFLRKSVWPLREVVGSMVRGDSPLIGETTRIYLRDIYDHTIHVIDTIETFRDMISGMLDIYLSSMSNRMNSIMKVLTIIATIFMPLTFIAGVYGMNFRYMPELSWRYAYLCFWVVNVIIAGSMLIFFRKKKWL